jgi:hypothetical protein
MNQLLIVGKLVLSTCELRHRVQATPTDEMYVDANASGQLRSNDTKLASASEELHID